MNLPERLVMNEPPPAAVRGRLPWVDVARGLCMIMVVMLHVDVVIYARFFDEGAVSELWRVLTSASKPMRMPTFFAVSGFLAARVIHDQWQAVLLKRIVFPYALYVVWLVVTLCSYALIAEDRDGVFLNFLKQYFEQLVWPNTSLWFVYALVLYFIIAKLFAGVNRLLVIALALFVSAFSESLDAGSDTVLIYIAKNAAFFLIGAYLPEVLKTVSHSASIRKFLIAGALYMASVALILFLGEKFIGVWVPASFAGIWLCLIFSSLVSGTRVAVPLTYIGQNTLPIFLNHMIFINIIYFIFSRFDGVVAFITDHTLLLAVMPIVLGLAVIAISLLVDGLLKLCGFGWMLDFKSFTRLKLVQMVFSPRKG